MSQRTGTDAKTAGDGGIRTESLCCANCRSAFLRLTSHFRLYLPRSHAV